MKKKKNFCSLHNATPLEYCDKGNPFGPDPWYWPLVLSVKLHFRLKAKTKQNGSERRVIMETKWNRDAMQNVFKQPAVKVMRWRNQRKRNSIWKIFLIYIILYILETMCLPKLKEYMEKWKQNENKSKKYFCKVQRDVGSLYTCNYGIIYAKLYVL